MTSERKKSKKAPKPLGKTEHEEWLSTVADESLSDLKEVAYRELIEGISLRPKVAPRPREIGERFDFRLALLISVLSGSISASIGLIDFFQRRLGFSTPPPFFVALCGVGLGFVLGLVVYSVVLRPKKNGVDRA